MTEKTLPTLQTFLFFYHPESDCYFMEYKDKVEDAVYEECHEVSLETFMTAALAKNSDTKLHVDVAGILKEARPLKSSPDFFEGYLYKHKSIPNGIHIHTSRVIERIQDNIIRTQHAIYLIQTAK